MSGLIIERHGHVGWLILNRPQVLNAMNTTMVLEELPAGWAELRDDPGVRVIVVAGEGRGFCTGVDIADLTENPEGMAMYEANVRGGTMAITGIHNQVWKPIITAVNGVCAGGGLHFVADGDITICASDSTFLDPHVSVGQVSTYEPIGLARRMPFDAVARMLFVGRHERLSAQRAYELGLVSQIVDPPSELRAEAQKLAELIAKNSPSAMMASKKALWESLDHGLHDSLGRGAELLAAFWNHPDNIEGPQSFMDKRDPNWAPPTDAL